MGVSIDVEVLVFESGSRRGSGVVVVCSYGYYCVDLGRGDILDIFDLELTNLSCIIDRCYRSVVNVWGWWENRIVLVGPTSMGTNLSCTRVSVSITTAVSIDYEVSH